MPRCVECLEEIEPPVGRGVALINGMEIELPAHESCVKNSDRWKPDTDRSAAGGVDK